MVPAPKSLWRQDALGVRVHSQQFMLVGPYTIITESKELAEAYVARHGHEHIYDRPGDFLQCGGLYIMDLSSLPFLKDETDLEISPWKKGYWPENMANDEEVDYATADEGDDTEDDAWDDDCDWGSVD